jgi:hypothetical protein
MSGLTLDAGALIAFERADRRVVAIVARALARKAPLAVPAGVVGQVWRGGSGRHFLVVQQGNGPAIDILGVRSTANELLDPLLQARFGVVRIH